MSEVTEKSPLKKTQNGDKFTSRAGVIATCLGCALGTGNVWRFPRMVALNSGRKGALCFLIPWTMFLFIWSIPMLLIEYGLGRFTGQGVVASIQYLAGDKFVWCGLWIVLVNFMIGCWYHVVMGWCIFYSYQVIFYPLPTTIAASNDIFNQYIVDSYWPVLTQAIGIFVTGLLMLRGIRMIERSNLVLMPLLLLLIVIVFIWSLTRQGAAAGLKFFFTPDWATLAKPRLWVDAASQNAFDCGAGWGQFIAFGAAMKSTDPIVKYAMLIPIGNNIISLMCGMLTFSTAFSSIQNEISQSNSTSYIVDILQTSGPASTGLTFIWLPVLFATAGVAGRVFASMFFVSLVIAGISSLIGTLENVIQVLVNYGVSRVVSVVCIVCATYLGGLGSSINMDFLTNQDFTWAFALIISGGFLQAVVVKYGTSKFREHIINTLGSQDWNVPKVWEWIINYMIPIQAIFLMVWWIVGVVISTDQRQHHWYEFGPQSLFPVLIQWTVAMIILAIINMVLLYLKPTWFMLHSISSHETLLNPDVADVNGETDSSQTETRNGEISRIADDTGTHMDKFPSLESTEKTQ